MVTEENGRTKKLYLIDGSGFIFRAFHALPPLTRPDGTPVGAVMGFCNMLLRIIEEAGSDYVAVVFDAARRNFRYDIYPEYKANRGETPEDLVPQFPLIRDAAAAFGLMSIELEGYEADDLIAAYAKEARVKGLEVKIVSSDKDLMQLMREGVVLFDPLKFKDLTLADVEKKFGVTPDKVVEVQALAGDSTDNIPGIPGIGVKTAALLINEYGDLETLLSHAGEIKQNKRRECLIEFADNARISKQLVKLDENAPLPVDLELLDDHVLDLNVLTDFLNEQGFRSLIARVTKKWWGIIPPDGVVKKTYELDVAVKTIDAPPTIDVAQLPVMTEIINPVYKLVTDIGELEDFVTRAHTYPIIALDTETTSLTPAKADLVGISLAFEAGNAVYVPLGHLGTQSQKDLFGEAPAPENKRDSIKQIPLKDALSVLKPLLENPAVAKVGHNMKYDLQLFFEHGIHITPLHDTMLMSYVLDGSKNGHGMDELCEINFAHKNIAYKDIVGRGKEQKLFSEISPEQALDYAAEDADMTLRLYQILSQRLINEKMLSVYETIERPLIPIMARMEWAGIKVDRDYLSDLSKDFAVQIHELEKTIYLETGQEFNLASPKQLGDVLFGSLGLPEGKKTKTGSWSTDAATLEKLAAQGHSIVEHILEWRTLSKLKSTYTDALQEQINPKTGRVHTSFSMAVTNTGRLSSSDPNLQNIPIRTEEGRKIRSAFIARDGYKLISIDYSQIELRLMAQLGNVTKLREAFAKGWDIHAMTASEVFGIPMGELSSERRRAAKAINFGIIYGISAFGLAKQLSCSVGEASEYIKLYMSRFPEIADFMDHWKEFAKRHGYVETFFGRRIYVPEIHADNHAMRSFGERQAINAPLQGTAADIMKMAMREVQNVLDNSNLDAKVLLQVHDELVIETAEKDCQTVIESVTQAMQNTVRFDVPLLVDAGIGSHWGDAH